MAAELAKRNITRRSGYLGLWPASIISSIRSTDAGIGRFGTLWRLSANHSRSASGHRLSILGSLRIRRHCESLSVRTVAPGHYSALISCGVLPRTDSAKHLSTVRQPDLLPRRLTFFEYLVITYGMQDFFCRFPYLCHDTHQTGKFPK